MKQKILSLAIIAASLNATSVLAGDPKVYGKANISLNQTDSGSTDTWKLNSNASRFGIKGSFDATDSIKAIYKFEYETFIDDGDDGKGNNSEFKQRNIYAGFQGNFGTIVAGNHDTPTKLAQGKIDRFNDLVLGDIKNVIQGENRASNIIMYTTPKMNGLSATVAFVPSEDDNGDISDGISATITYKADAYSLTVAHDDGETIDSSVESLTRLVGEYKGDGFKLGALYQVADEGSNDEDGYVLSGEYKLSNGLILKGQYAQSDDESTEITQTAVGVDYKLGKKSKIFSYYTNIENDNGVSVDANTFAVGYEIKF
ncbi:MAG: porin [Pseudomonadales bacterium]|nr:porin [Pseudomonadales bacterium]